MVAAELPDGLYAQSALIVDALKGAASGILDEAALQNISLSGLRFTEVTDPGNQLPGFEGIWRDLRRVRCGSLTFNSDGSFYAEFDLFMPHPERAGRFVEMVTAWGRADALRVELQTAPM